MIPEILGAVSGQEELPLIEKPERCPACGAMLEEVGPNLYCPNTLSCKPQLISRMEHFVSRDAMNIEGLSGKTLERLYGELNIADAASLYELTEEDLVGLEGFKEKKASNIIEAINASKEPELPSFIFALGINNVGKSTAIDLAEKFGSMDVLKNATFDDLVAIKDVGSVVAMSIIDFFSSKQVQKTLERFHELGIRPKEYKQKKASCRAKMW